MCYFCVFIGFWWKSPHFPYNSDPWQCLFSPVFFTVGVPTTHPSNILLPKPSKNEALEQVLQLSFDCLKKYCKLKKVRKIFVWLDCNFSENACIQTAWSWGLSCSKLKLHAKQNMHSQKNYQWTIQKSF